MDKLDTGNKVAGLLGGIVGAAVGMLGGPVASIAGGAAGSVVADVLKDMAARTLSNRERIRFDNATLYVADSIIKSIKAGLIVRQDGFFEGDTNFWRESY
jgi:outer membrane lipoprotein SlyB